MTDHTSTADTNQMLEQFASFFREIHQVPETLPANLIEHPEARLSVKRLQRIIIHEVNRVAPEITDELAEKSFEAVLAMESATWSHVHTWLDLQQLVDSCATAAEVQDQITAWADKYNMNVDWWLDAGLYTLRVWRMIVETAANASISLPRVRPTGLVSPAPEALHVGRPYVVAIVGDAVLDSTRQAAHETLDRLLDRVEADAIDDGYAGANSKKPGTLLDHVEWFIRFQMIGTSYDALVDQLDSELPPDAPFQGKTKLVNGILSVAKLSLTQLRTGGERGGHRRR